MFLLQPTSFVHLRAYATHFKITIKTTVIVHILNLGFQMLQKQAIRPFCVNFKMSLIKMPCLFVRNLLSLLQLADNGWATDESRFDSRKRRKILCSPKYPYRLSGLSQSMDNGETFTGVKRLTCKANHQPPTNARVTNK